MADKTMLTNRIIRMSVLPLFKVLYEEADDPITCLLYTSDAADE